MTNEEKKAEEYVNETFGRTNPIVAMTYTNIYLEGYEEGRKEGYKQGYEDCRDYYKSKWHDLREDPNDLPKESGEYWSKWEDGAYSTAHYFTDIGFGNYIIAWCELPKFEEKK